MINNTLEATIMLLPQVAADEEITFQMGKERGYNGKKGTYKEEMYKETEGKSEMKTSSRM